MYLYITQNTGILIISKQLAIENIHRLAHVHVFWILEAFYLYTCVHVTVCVSAPMLLMKLYTIRQMQPTFQSLYMALAIIIMDGYRILQNVQGGKLQFSTCV